jgi:hypothetical protein
MLMRHQSSQEHHFSQVIEGLDRVSRAMNPLLLFIAVSLVVLNLACVVNLIDWTHLAAQSPAENAATTSSALTSAATSGAQVPKAPSAVSSHRLPSSD